MRDRMRSGTLLAAPHVIDLEVTRALRRLESRLGASRTDVALQDFQATGLTRYPHSPLVSRIWELRSNMTTYDAAYIALAERLGGPLLTLDARLAQTPGHGANVEVLG